MKKKSKRTFKATVSIFIVGIFLLTIIPVNTSIQISSREFQPSYYQSTIIMNKIQNNESLLVCPSSALIYLVPTVVARLTGKPYILLRNWEGKQFPNTTIMFIGRICSIRPLIGIQYSIFSYSMNPPKKVEVVCDNKTYATLKGFSIPNVPITYYPFYYTKKGFHHLKFVPDGNESACINIDFQVGFKGFLNNILPYIGP